jgi:hypothetical protein
MNPKGRENEESLMTTYPAKSGQENNFLENLKFKM